MANYLRKKLTPYYKQPFDRHCMHECVFSADWQAEKGVHAIDLAKGLLDKGFHPPTMYFPLIVHEALMIEPTETESKETIDAFANALIELAEEVKNNPESIVQCPLKTPVKRLDEALAARKPVLAYEEE